MTKFERFIDLKGLPIKLRLKLTLLYDEFSEEVDLAYENLFDMFKRKGLTEKEIDIYISRLFKDIPDGIY